MNEEFYSELDSKAQRVAYLIAGYIRKTLSENEHDELDDWVNASDQNMLLFEDLTDEKNIQMNLEMMDRVQVSGSFARLMAEGAWEKEKEAKVRKIGRRRIIGWVAAATVIIAVAVVALVLPRGEDVKPPIASQGGEYLQPGGNRATLTLANGTVIDLVKQENGIIETTEAGVTKSGEGELTYQNQEGAAAVPAMHELRTPVGGQFQVVLPDGTKAWLNAASSLRYPAAFAGNERVVQLEGEAFFQVAKDLSKPFRVQMPKGGEVQVLGTSFNVNCYGNEDVQEITTLEGTVRVTGDAGMAVLERGMQVRLNEAGLEVRKGVDTEEVTGWKDGRFIFRDASMGSIMRQVERWYDAEVVYKGKIDQQFNATILRSESLEKLLMLLELNGYVHFKTENRMIYVSP